jgi:hypothetical protein
MAELEQTMSRYKIMIDDNFHYMDEDHRYEWKRFPTVDEAVAECKRIVDSDLAGYMKPGITAAELYDYYTSFGDDPFIMAVDPNAQPTHFSAWDYAKERSNILTSPDKAGSTMEPTGKKETVREKAMKLVSTNPRFKLAPNTGQGFIILGARAPVERKIAAKFGAFESNPARWNDREPGSWPRTSGARSMWPRSRSARP